MKSMVRALREEIAMVTEVAAIADALNHRRITPGEAAAAITRLGRDDEGSIAA